MSKNNFAIDMYEQNKCHYDYKKEQILIFSSPKIFLQNFMIYDRVFVEDVTGHSLSVVSTLHLFAEMATY